MEVWQIRGHAGKKCWELGRRQGSRGRHEWRTPRRLHKGQTGDENSKGGGLERGRGRSRGAVGCRAATTGEEISRIRQEIFVDSAECELDVRPAGTLPFPEAGFS